MKKFGTIIWLICIICLISGYGLFLYKLNLKDDGKSPVLTFDNQVLEISVNDDKSILFDGIKATDQEDGDLTQDIIIESISTFDDNNNRTVNYAVFDKDRHVTKASRKVHYIDYTKPRIYLKNTLISEKVSYDDIKNLVGATSCVDGDITDQAVVQVIATNDPIIFNVIVTVKDSTGQEEKVEMVYNYDRNYYSTKITLNEYLVYIKQGETFNPLSNIKEIKSSSVKDKQEKYLIIDNQVNSDVPGVYEVKYSFSHFGDNGISKCIVVVE